MQREFLWFREDIPTSNYAAVQFNHKVFWYLRQIGADIYARELVNNASTQINLSEEYVSTYVDKSANVQAQAVYVGEVQEPTHKQDCGCPECGMLGY